MEETTLDRLARALAQPVTRRHGLAALAGLLGITGFSLVAEDTQATKKAKRRRTR